MGNHIIAMDCPVCGARKYVEEGRKMDCCPEVKKGGKKKEEPKVPVVAPETTDTSDEAPETTDTPEGA